MAVEESVAEAAAVPAGVAKFAGTERMAEPSWIEMVQAGETKTDPVLAVAAVEAVEPQLEHEWGLVACLTAELQEACNTAAVTATAAVAAAVGLLGEAEQVQAAGYECLIRSRTF